MFNIVNAQDIPPLCINIDRVITSYLVYLLAQIYHGTIHYRRIMSFFIIAPYTYLLTYLRTLGIYNLLRKVTKRMYCTNYLFRAGVRPFVIACVWTSIICSILELYACPVWHLGLTKKLSKDIECVQQCHVKLLFPALSYTESLHKSGLERLDDHRDMITQSLFTQIKDPKYPLHYLLPHHTKVSLNHMALRPTYPYQIPLAKTSRYGTNCTVLHCQHHKRQIDGEIM